MKKRKDFKDALIYVFVQFTLTSVDSLIKSFHFVLAPKDVLQEFNLPRN